jgi:DNA-binding XRE family transcriptional regulator
MPSRAQYVSGPNNESEPIPRVLRQLVLLRRNADITQHALAAAIGTTQSAISEMETGVVSPTLTTLSKYAEHFDMEVVLAVKEQP